MWQAVFDPPALLTSFEPSCLLIDPTDFDRVFVASITSTAPFGLPLDFHYRFFRELKPFVASVPPMLASHSTKIAELNVKYNHFIKAKALGIGRAALRRATDYANERIIFDRPIGQNQGIAFPLAEAHMKLKAAELIVREASWRYDRGLSCAEAANTAKYLASEAAFFAADRAMQTHGGFGYADEYHVGRYWREARLMKIAPVSQEMVLNFISNKILGLPRSY